MEPKNLVKENLFSKGELFLNNVEYIGPYNVKADGTYHTLSRFITKKSKQLKTKKSTLYQDLLKINGGIDVSEKNGQVVDNTILPTNEDYTKGFYTRYFIKTKGSKSISEVNEETLGLLGQKIDDNLYVGFELDWKLTGPLNDIFVGGIRQQAGVRDTNRRTLQRLEQEYIGITEKLQKSYTILQKYLVLQILDTNYI